MIRANRNFACQTYDIYDTAGAEPGEAIDPTYCIQETEAQQLFDDLYASGLRPTEGRASAGQLAATEKHLNHVTSLLERVLPLATRKD